MKEEKINIFLLTENLQCIDVKSLIERKNSILLSFVKSPYICRFFLFCHYNVHDIYEDSFYDYFRNNRIFIIPVDTYTINSRLFEIFKRTEYGKETVSFYMFDLPSLYQSKTLDYTRLLKFISQTNFNIFSLCHHFHNIYLLSPTSFEHSFTFSNTESIKFENYFNWIKLQNLDINH